MTGFRIIRKLRKQSEINFLPGGALQQFRFVTLLLRPLWTGQGYMVGGTMRVLTHQASVNSNLEQTLRIDIILQRMTIVSEIHMSSGPALMIPERPTAVAVLLPAFMIRLQNGIYRSKRRGQATQDLGPRLLPKLFLQDRQLDIPLHGRVVIATRQGNRTRVCQCTDATFLHHLLTDLVFRNSSNAALSQTNHNHGAGKMAIALAPCLVHGTIATTGKAMRTDMTKTLAKQVVGIQVMPKTLEIMNTKIPVHGM
jgi:hypothetical protein